MIDVDALSKPYKIHCCKDGTITVRGPGEAVFNGVALPVYSAETREEAESLVVATCSSVRGEHPLLPGQPWYKINGDAFSGLPAELELDHLVEVTERLKSRHEMLRRRSGRITRNAHEG